MFFYEPSSDGLGVNTWGLLPFSRGNVSIAVRTSPASLSLRLTHHMQSTDPFAKPNIRVGYLSVDFDLAVAIAGARAMP